ncbi:unnamed protein product [Arabidopsis thaliana]|uniref:Myb/SANT-like domain-containing protein n=1 Tax=Arabidopsis thaliana TaxID=3702 RepID=A0A654G598_ARATH|nr:unnamed protein product [Arabidopsis thaliana]
MSKSQQDQEKKSYLPWSPQETRTLIDLLLDGLASGWRNSSGVFSKFTVERKILPIVNQKHGSDKTHKHYLNRMKTLKGKYAHPSYKKFKDETFEEFDDLKMIFEDNIATGGNAIELGDGTDARTCEIAGKKQTSSIEDFLWMSRKIMKHLRILWTSIKGALQKNFL